MIDGVERLLYWFGSVFMHGDAVAGVQLRAPVDEDIFSTVADDLLSGVEILGSKQIVGDAEYQLASRNLGVKLAQRLRAGGGKQHSIGIGFRSSVEGAPRLIEEIMQGSSDTVKRFGALDDLVKDIVATLSRICVDESVYLVFLTHKGGLTPSELERAALWRQQTQAKVNEKGGRLALREGFAQNPRTPFPALFPRHKAAYDNLIADLELDAPSGGVGLLVRRLDCAELCNLMRRQYDGSAFPRTWKPLLLGNRLSSATLQNPRKGDRSDSMPMAVGRQMVQQGFMEDFAGLEMARCGSRWYGSVVLEVMPHEGSRPFNELVDRIGRRIPWSVGFEIIGNGLKSRGMDKFYSSFVGGFGEHNKAVNRAWKELAKTPDVSALRCVFSTWASSRQGLIEALEFLKSSVEGWGSAVVTNETGMPAQALLSTAAGLTHRSPAPYIPGPLAELAKVLPVFRPASIWSEGHLIAHTLDGRPYPIQFGSQLQAFWGVGLLAPSGLGKSTLLSSINLGLVFSPGLLDLPYITVLDAGESSKFPFDLAKELLPPHLASQIAHVKVRNQREYATNPFDTQLGADRLLPVELDFAVQVVSTVVPYLGDEGEQFIRVVITEAFSRFGRNSPDRKVWDPTFDPIVHEAAIKAGMVFSDALDAPKVRVWDVVDFLFSKGLVNEASRAQRFAVPILQDLVTASRARKVVDLYRAAKTGKDELVLDVFERNIMAAQENYQLIANYTQFDIGTARVVTVDLEEVLGSQNTEDGKRRSALMFLLGRRIGARNYFLHLLDVKNFFPAMYEPYQVARIKALQEQIKLLEYDEKHYTTGVESVDRQIGIDMRVGRKYRVITMMSSQMLADFKPDMVENMYTVIVLGAGSTNSLDAVQNTFSLTDTERHAIESYCIGGGRMFATFKSKRGRTSQLLQNALGPLLAWVTNTSDNDVPLRRELVERHGYMKALRALAGVYPKGSARAEIERYMQRRGSDAATVDRRPMAQIFADIVEGRAREAGIEM